MADETKSATSAPATPPAPFVEPVANPAPMTAVQLQTAGKPLAAQGALIETGAAAQASLDPPREVPAAERLRAFEDEMFGKAAVRISGQVERGSGSLFQNLTPAQRRHYEALEALRPAEVRLADAHAELIAAETAHEAALSAVDKTSEGI